MTARDLFQDLQAVESLLASPPFALITDVDGVIAELAPTASEASVSPACRDALARLAGNIALTAAVSGRAVQDVRRMVGLDGLVYVGNHGVEQWRDGQVETDPGVAAYLPLLRAAVRELGAALEEPGVYLEDKGVGVAVHFRRAPDPAAAERRLREALRASPSAGKLRVDSGKMMLELKPPVDVNKGVAVERLVQGNGARSAVYVGDDVTDLDAFRVLRRMREEREGFRGLAVGVLGGKETPEALEAAVDFTLADVDAACRFYGWLADRARRA